MWDNASLIDKGRLYSKVVYIYFCFFSMAAAERFSMSIVYGAALYFSLSALFRMFGFTIKTLYDSSWLRGIKTAIVVFFMLATMYIIGLYPFLFTHEYTAYAIVIIALPFIERDAEDFFLRKRAKLMPPGKRDILKTILPIELFFILIACLISLLIGPQAFMIVLAGMTIGMGFQFFRQFIFHEYAAEYPKPGVISEDVKHIRSARLFDGMVITSGAALNIFAFTYILFIMFSRTYDLITLFFVVFGGLALVFGAVYLGTFRVFRSALIQKIGKNAAFILGTAIAIFAVYIFRESWFQGAFAITLQTVLLLFGLILQMTAAATLKEDVILAIKLYNPDVDNKALGERSSRLEVWTSVISEAVFLAVLLILVSDPLIYKMNIEDYIRYAPYIGSSVIVIPTAFLIISLGYSIKQPLTKKYGQKLKAYAKIRSEGKENPDMEKRLKSVLIKKYKKRIGIHIIRLFLHPIMYHTVQGKEYVTDLPGVFVFNHREFYGPIAAVVFLPYDIRPWILNKMIDKNEVFRHIYDGTFGRIKWLPVIMRKCIARVMSPIVVWALNSFDPIPVYRGTARSVIKTFSLSIECLNAGDSILLFPENPEEDYSEQVSDFYTGFANLGRLYYKKTKQKVTFYPVYASMRGRVLRIGEGVRYEPDNGRKEKDRIVTTLQHRMQALQRQDDL